jgi:hypothetical protein
MGPYPTELRTRVGAAGGQGGFTIADIATLLGSG